MKINEIIRERRLAKRLTQEQLANIPGVTAPAVNKWEKGSSYPDITLLPALARMLDTDLNTLFSFREEMTEKEIALFLNRLSELAKNGGFDKAYAAACEKVKEYPSCYSLLLNTALWLDGAALLYAPDGSAEEIQAAAENLYQRVLNSQDPALTGHARSMLFSRCMEKKEYDQAQELLRLLPDETPVDKKQLQANLFIACGKLEEAAKLEEEKLLSATNEIHTILITLMEIAITENRNEDAEYIAEVSRKGAKLFDLSEYSSYIAHFQLYMARKDRTKCLELLFSLLKSLTHNWAINKSPLYRHIKTKAPENDFGAQMQKMILQAICKDEHAVFLHESREFQELLQSLNAEGESIPQTGILFPAQPPI